MTYRVTHHHQQGARLAWNDTLFQTVEPAWEETEPMPLPEVEEIEVVDGEGGA